MNRQSVEGGFSFRPSLRRARSPMLPGKVYSPEDVVRILRKRITASARAVRGRRRGDSGGQPEAARHVRSDALVLVVPQRVPENFVKSTVTTRIEIACRRSRSRSQAALASSGSSRTSTCLQERKDGGHGGCRRQDARRHQVDVVRATPSASTMSAAIANGHEGQRSPLVAVHRRESLRDRQVLAEGTDQFIEAQLEDARRRLESTKKKLEAYRKQFAGQLPSQLESNLQVIQSTTLRSSRSASRSTATATTTLMLDRRLNDLTAAAAAALPHAVDQDPGSGGSAAQQLPSPKRRWRRWNCG